MADRQDEQQPVDEPVEQQPGAEPDEQPDPPADEPDEQPDEVDDDARGNREAARRRRELREVRADRDRLAEVVATYQRRDVEAAAAAHLIDPADVWRDGLQLADVVDEHGQVDAARLAEAVAEVVEAHPHWRRRGADAARAGLTGSGGAPSTSGTGVAGLADALRSVARS